MHNLPPNILKSVLPECTVTYIYKPADTVLHYTRNKSVDESDYYLNVLVDGDRCVSNTIDEA